jgi:hypothetical protein
MARSRTQDRTTQDSRHRPRRHASRRRRDGRARLSDVVASAIQVLSVLRTRFQPDTPVFRSAG